MATLSHTYRDHTAHDATVEARERTGGPRRSIPADRRDIWYERFASSSTRGSHMPLDTELHWDWRNPLNIIPALLLLFTLITLIALIVG